MRKALPAIEALVVVALFLFFRVALRDSRMADWQQAVFGAAPVSSSLLFFVLPLVVILALRRTPGASGLTTQEFGYHRSVAMRALAIVAPVTVLFPLVELVGSGPMDWLGGSVLALGFTVGGLLMAQRVGRLASRPEASLGLKGLSVYVGFLVTGGVLVALLNPLSPLLARMVFALVFVGFLEEFFFRGYIQSRLNESFGKPYIFHGVGIGGGLPIAAAIFGLMHPLTALGETTPWAWALWTSALGFFLGFLREKTGAVLAPAMVHGVLLLPGVLFGAVGK